MHLFNKVVFSTTCIACMLACGCNESANKVIKADFNDNGIAESYMVDNYQLIITEDEKELFKTDPDWKVNSISFSDMNNDGYKDVLLLVENHLQYGTYHPFFKENDTSNLYQHVYIYTYKDGTYVPLWMSSALDQPYVKIRGLKDQTFVLTDPNKKESKWKMNGFQVERIDD